MIRRQLHFGLNVLSAGMHPAAWLAKESDPLGYVKPEQWLRLVQVAERGPAATRSSWLTARPRSGCGRYAARPAARRTRPLVLLSSLAPISTYVGLAATVNTTYEETRLMNVARRFASLDHVSRGRAAWNVVTTVDATVPGTLA